MKRITPIKYLSAVIATFVGVILLSASVKAWGPEDRPTYTNESPAPYATFNSITDNAAVGDERNFVRVAEAGTADSYVDEIEVVPGKEYEVYIYYHNDAGSNTNAAGYGMATDTRIASAYPSILNPGDRGMVSGIISWSYVTPSDPNNAQIGKVWDEAYFTTKYENVILRYKTGTATIHNAGKANGSILSTNLFTEDGTLIGFNKLSGTIPGCAEYSGYITYTLIAELTASDLTKQVSLDGENWSDTIATKPGNYVTYKVTFKNTGNTTLTNVIFKDTHSDELSLRSGSTVIYDVDNTSGKTIEDILDISGYNVGEVAPGALVQIIYQVKISDKVENCPKLNNIISVAYNGADQKKAESFVELICEPEPEPGKPSGSINKTVSSDGVKYSDSVAIAPGDEAYFQLEIKNTSDVALVNIKIKDTMPAGLTLVSGSIRLITGDSTEPTPLPDDLTSDGYSFGNLDKGTSIYLTYRAKADDNFDCKGKTLTNTATLTYDDEDVSSGTHTDSSTIIVKKVLGCDPEKPTEIVNTGPLEITMAVLIIVAIGGVGVYYWHTKRTLKTVKDKASGKTHLDGDEPTVDNHEPLSEKEDQNQNPTDQTDPSSQK